MIDQSGNAILAVLQKSAAQETCDRALAMAHQLTLDLKAAEERAQRLQAKVQR